MAQIPPESICPGVILHLFLTLNKESIKLLWTEIANYSVMLWRVVRWAGMVICFLAYACVRLRWAMRRPYAYACTLTPCGCKFGPGQWSAAKDARFSYRLIHTTKHRGPHRDIVTSASTTNSTVLFTTNTSHTLQRAAF